VDPDGDRVKNILYLRIPPNYLADHAGFFAESGVDGIMVATVVNDWFQDIWSVPNRYAPDEPAGRVVGDANPLFQMCRRMNDSCRVVGMEHNSLTLAATMHGPNWFNDAEWDSIRENLRELAVFAQGAGFAGLSFDIEYISELYELDYPTYREPGYPFDRLRPQVRMRGREIAEAMLDGFPDLVLWFLPEWAPTNTPLGEDIFTGMMQAFAERDAPGGFHVSTEMTYAQTRPRALLTLAQSNERAFVGMLRENGGDRSIDYWKRRGTSAIGTWPLGYYREILDSSGAFLGHGGRAEVFGDSLVGSMADKSENYPATAFRHQYASARMISGAYAWLYCHGQVFLRMTPEDMVTYVGSPNDTLPIVPNVAEYLAVIRDREALHDDLFAEAARNVREHREPPQYDGFPRGWLHTGPFVGQVGDFDASYPRGDALPETAEPPQAVALDSSNYVDLKAIFGKEGTPVAWSVTHVELARPERVWIRFGSNDYGAVFVDGERIATLLEPRPAAIDDDSFPVDLPAGTSEIAVKIGDAGGSEWGFYLRITAEDGDPVPDLRWVDP